VVAGARWALAIGNGLALGGAASWTDAWSGHLWDVPAWRTIDLVLNAGSVWACVAILAGWLVAPVRWSWAAGTLALAAAAGILALAAAVGGYYAYGNVAGDRLGFGLSALSGVLRFWLAAALVLGPVLGTVGALARRPDGWGLTARLVPSAGILGEDALARLHGAGGDAAAEVALGLLLAAATGWAVAVVASWRRGPGRVPG